MKNIENVKFNNQGRTRKIDKYKLESINKDLQSELRNVLDKLGSEFDYIRGTYAYSTHFMNFQNCAKSDAIEFKIYKSGKILYSDIQRTNANYYKTAELYLTIVSKNDIERSVKNWLTVAHCNSSVCYSLQVVK
jgi:hypothetical protein